MSETQIERIRSFNRAVTQRIGVLEDSYLSRGRPLGEARLLFEIGLAGGIELAALRTRLGLDSGYLSRLLRSLERQDLVEVERRAGDRRARQVVPTEAGKREFCAYDRLSDRLAETILAGLDAGQGARLIEAMAVVEHLLRLSAIVIAPEPADSAGARWCLAHYYDELARRFEGGFDPDAGNTLSPREMTPPSGWMLVARLQGEPAGCGALKRLDAATAEVKRVWVSPSSRGVGLAGRLMDRLEGLARENGFGRIVLDTNRALGEAQALYRKRGYREIARYNDNPYAHHWFEKTL